MQNRIRMHCEGCSEDHLCQIRGYLRVIREYDLISECPCNLCLAKLKNCSDGCEDYTNFVLRCTKEIQKYDKMKMARLFVDILKKEGL